ncbi:type I-MYXAN CRISPR-associated endonuclease Cas1 [Nodosilinea sp. LEGE 07088]|uniref:type I-MYXAN CRISPR-associated endonuclease Cas4/Cas1 n=1 Tax=Nodosilinea sp. LEGE 07088 TaxID=2777968 RepID=UPI00187E36BE|nr:type I-MYXAN CRISPR-associated endonuclease Cas1 [Nodosilinea sp. LEGE 07088]MBE9138188.1 type I-MYXAN CRISPR-associated endonuclease Cas1 [Nodosilinea sp. LEGE 07088]
MTIPHTAAQVAINVSALQALFYCPRQYYLQEVEGIHTPNAEVYSGLRLHTELERDGGDEWQQYTLESEALGLRGRVDALKTRAGQTIPYEHKKGRCYRDSDQQPQAWPGDRIQVLAYALLLEAELGISITEGRVRYHGDNVLVHVPFDAAARQDLLAAIKQAQQLQVARDRPPVADNANLCTCCSVAEACMPDATRLAQGTTDQPLKLFPQDDERQIIHVTEAGTSIGKSGDQFKITKRDGKTTLLPSRQVGQLVLHSYVQISTQAMYFCAEQGVGLHFISGRGQYQGSFDTRQGNIQRRVRQYQALTDTAQCLRLAQQLVTCRGQSQRKFLMRSQRQTANPTLKQAIDQMQRTLNQVPQAESIPSLLGLEGNLAAQYFGALPQSLADTANPAFRFSGRNRRPPKDRFNAMLGFGYALLLKDVMNAILTVGLEPALGFYHQPQRQAPPLALDLMEIFRVPLVDMPVMAAINRNQWDADADFEITGEQVWLNDSGRRKLIALYERRKEETWKHPVVQYSMTYRRLIELEVRLLEKEWLGEGGLFAQLVLR